MPITVSCPSCREAVSYPDGEAGRQVRCYRCGVPISLASTASPPAGSDGMADTAEKAGKVADAGHKVYSLYTKVVASAGGFSGLMGMVGDFLKPLAAFNLIAFVVSALLATFAVTLWVKGVRPLGRSLAPACAVLLCLALGFGGWWGLAYLKGGREKGYLAGHFGFVDRLQSSVVTKVDGPGLGQEVRTQQRAEQKTAQSVEEVLKGYPASVLRAEVVGKPRPRAKKGDVIDLEYDLKVSVDTGKYEAVVASLGQIFDKAALRKGEIVTSARKNDSYLDEHSILKDFAIPGPGKATTSTVWSSLDYGTRVEGDADLNTRLSSGESNVLVFLNTTRSGTGQNLTWQWYLLQDRPEYRPGLNLDIRLRGQSGRELDRRQFKLWSATGRDDDGFGISPPHWNNGVKQVWIAPYYLDGSNGRYCSSVTGTSTVSLTQADLDQVGEIAVTLQP